MDQLQFHSKSRQTYLPVHHPDLSQLFQQSVYTSQLTSRSQSYCLKLFSLLTSLLLFWLQSTLNHGSNFTFFIVVPSGPFVALFKTSCPLLALWKAMCSLRRRRIVFLSPLRYPHRRHQNYHNLFLPQKVKSHP